MTTIYIDTNIFMNERFFRSASAQAFLKACSLLQITVVIPDVVLDEVLGNFPRRLTEKFSKFKQAHRELNGLVDLTSIPFDLSSEIDSYKDWLLELIEQSGVVIAAYPDVSAKELVLKSYEGRKPHKEGGEGYKDYLVWQTIKEHILAKTSTPPNIFLTQNTKDFGVRDGNEKSVLHPDLAGQIAEIQRRPKIYTSMKSAFDQHLAPSFQDIALQDIPEIDVNKIQNMVEKHLLDDLSLRTAFGFEDVPFSNDVSITGVGDANISEIQLTKVSDEIIITVIGIVEIEVEGFIDKHSYYLGSEDEVDISIVDADWNDHVMAVGVEVDTAFELRLFYSMVDKEVTAHELTLPQEIEDDWPYK